MTDLSNEFRVRIVNTFGEDGRRWLDSLPSILEQLSSRWNLCLLKPFTPLSFNYVAPALRGDDFEVVLKVGVPNPEITTEIAALKAFDGNGVVTLYESDSEFGALLLERLRPGKPLFDQGDEAFATGVACEIIRSFRTSSPVEEVFPTVGDWFHGFQRLRDQYNGETGPFPSEIIDKAESISHDLLSSMEPNILLHGDLHHWNVLSGEREPWMAIDPKGVIGEPAYETGAWIRNPFPVILEMVNPDQIIARRIDQFSEALGYDPERLRGWGYSQAVLSAYWAFEAKDGDWQEWLVVARLIEKSMNG
jgi:streptomycin 6-kinase